MSSTRPRRAQAAAATPTKATEIATSSSRRSSRKIKIEPEPEPERELEESEETEEEEQVEEEEEDVKPGPSRRRGRGSVRGRGSTRGQASRRGRGRVAVRNGIATEEDEDEDVTTTPARRTRLRKSVSYKELPEVVAEPAEEEEDEEDAEEERPTPGRRKHTNEDSNAEPEKVGSGRGGFSVKGNAAAAARARWERFRREKAERGEDDDDRVRRKPGGGRQREARAAKETYEVGSTLDVRGKEYTLGDDELELPDNEKGDTKIDAEGRLLGGREYKLQTFTSSSRRNPDRVYGLTIDVARACGYTDSLAFLRRCPTLLKLSCTQEEREMLIDIGRVTGNLKNRMVTITTMKNAFKLMGARLVKNGKWVTDDYDEEESLAKCKENGFTPYGIAHEDEIIANAISALQPVGRPPVNPQFTVEGGAHIRSAVALTPFYTVGGPSTHFAGAGIDPCAETGYGGRRAKLRMAGVTEEDWMYYTAESSRALDIQLREYRDERLVELEGADATNGWVFGIETMTDGQDQDHGKEAIEEDMEGEVRLTNGPFGSTLKPPDVQRKRSGLSQEATLDDEALTPLATSDGGEEAEHPEASGVLEDGRPKQNGFLKPVVPPKDGREESKIIVQTLQDEQAQRSTWNWGVGTWQPGTIFAAYEPHTHMPHIPSFTQPNSSSIGRISHHPVLASQSDPEQRNFVQSSVSGKAARGLSSIENVFEPSTTPSLYEGRHVAPARILVPGDESEKRKRLRDVGEALEWEKESRKRQRLANATAKVS